MSNMTRFDPFNEMMSLREAMNSLLEDSFVNPSYSRGQAPITMAMDVAETKDGFVVEASLPGIKPEDLDINLQDNVLTISGEVRREETTGDKPNYHRVERRFGRFSRSISLPTQVDAEKIQASLNQGVLRLDLPKAEAVKPRKITVNSGTSNGKGETIDVNPEKANARGK